ncbi:helix-turn-helix domain-containing protein [Escherichia coli]|nr:helix-turn-helix domain-containing protein [Escherichia coli]
MSNNEYGELFTPSFKRMLQLEFKKPVATTVNKNTGEVKHRYKLNTNEMLVYGEIACFYFHGKTVYISEQTLADQYGWTPKTVRTAIHSLENAGLINVKREQGKSNIYELLVTPSQIGEMCDQQGVELFKGYKAAAEQVKQVDNQSQEAPKHPEGLASLNSPRECGKQATQQPEKPEAMQSPSQPKNERRERRRDAGKREKDFYGYPVLTNSEAKAAYLAAKAKYKSKGRVKLSVLRDEIYGYEVMKNIKGTIDGKIMNSAKYWHLTDQAFRLANLLKENEGIEIIVDTEANPGDLSKPFPAWQNCRLRDGKMVLLDK